MTIDNEHPLTGLDVDLGPTRASPMYLAVLTLGAVLTAVLPAVYLGLIAMAAWATVLFAQTQVGILSSGTHVLLAFAMYLAPIFCGGMLVVSMVRALFVPRHAKPQVVLVERADDPMLYLFVERLARLVHAPAPARIEVTSEVTAYVRLGDSALSLAGGDATVTLGLPLLRSMSRAQVAAILAHELGHLSQGLAMRLTWFMDTVIGWLWMMVHWREGDEEMDAAMADSQWFIQLPYLVARLFLWLVRGVLFILLQAAIALRLLLARQEEFGADRRAIRLVGSKEFADALTRLVTLQLTEAWARARWAQNGSLPPDVSVSLAESVAALPPQLAKDVQRAIRAGTTRWHDTHPSDKDRIAAAWRLSERGVYRHASPASGLVRDIDRLGRASTSARYPSKR